MSIFEVVTRFGHELYIEVEAEDEEQAGRAAKSYTLQHILGAECSLDEDDVSILGWKHDWPADFEIRAVGQSGRWEEK